jgi:hypothetical protein
MLIIYIAQYIPPQMKHTITSVYIITHNLNTHYIFQLLTSQYLGTLQTSSNMFSQSMSASAPNYEQVYPTAADNKGTVAGGSLKKGLDRLTRVLERRVDRQIMTAQIRAYDNSEHDSNKVRYT